MKKKTLFIPSIGKSTEIIETMIKGLGIKTLTLPITEETIKKGTKNAMEMVCYPFKICLGQMIQALDKGADSIIFYNTEGFCVFRCYHVALEQILDDMGYKFKMYCVSWRHPFKIISYIKELNPRVSFLQVLKAIKKTIKKLKELDKKEKEINKGSDIKIGVIGEIYICNVPDSNTDIIKKLQDMGVYVDNHLSIFTFLKNAWHKIGIYPKHMKESKKEADNYFNEKVGGHAKQGIINMISYAKQGYDGIIHLKPAFCNPESVIEKILGKISEDYDIPLMALSFDESSSKTHNDTRIEAFVNMIKMKKRGMFL